MRTIYSFTVILTLIGASLLNLNAQSAKRIVTGVVLSERSDSVGFITIKIKGTKEGSVSNSAGMFTIATALKGVQTLIVKNLAYEPFEQRITLDNDNDNDNDNDKENDTIRITIQLLTKVVNLKGTTVSASAFTSGDMEGVTLKPLEILTTPGAAADIFRALQTFPGVTSPDEGSGLIVRGGDINETVTLIDQASVAAPYRAQAPNGGTFGFIPPFFVSGTFFSSGGMPARYGNALSGVVALEGLGMPTGNQATATLSTGGVSLGGASELVPRTLGLRASGNYSNTDVLFRLNGLRGRFVQPPTSVDVNASLVWKYSTTGSLKVFSYGSQNGLQTFYGFGAAQNLFKTAQVNTIHNMQLTDIWQEWVIKSSLSANTVRNTIELDAFSSITEQINLKTRTDAEKDITDVVRVLLGVEAEYDELEGTKIIRNQGNAEARYSSKGGAVRLGGYIETEMKLTRDLLAGVGIRSDYNTLAQNLVFDPRVSMRYVFTPSFNLRAAWGIFHQFGRPEQVNAALGGNPDLKAQQATHYILGGEYVEGDAHVRIEAYNKTYANLILPTTSGSPQNRGYGYARGVDVFAKYGEYLKTDFNGWLSYSFLETHRLQARRSASGIRYEEGATPFDIRHNIVLVGKARVWEGLSMGITARYSTGRAMTPVVGGFVRVEGGYTWFEPIDGTVGSERLPDQMRLDADVSYFLPISDNAFMVMFASLSNATGRANVLGYTYSDDYSRREPNMSLNRQFVFLGATATVRF
jgi:vitamin B12 transporter